jgi:hypothetical protein
LQEPVEQQVNICICGMYQEPPALYLAAILAEAGESSVPLFNREVKNGKGRGRPTQHNLNPKGDGREGYLRQREDVLQGIEASWFLND